MPHLPHTFTVVIGQTIHFQFTTLNSNPLRTHASLHASVIEEKVVTLSPLQLPRVEGSCWRPTFLRLLLAYGMISSPTGSIFNCDAFIEEKRGLLHKRVPSGE